MKPKKPKPRCPSCRRVMRYLYIRNYYERVKLGFYCPGCNKVKLKPGIKVIQQDIFIGLNKF